MKICPKICNSCLTLINHEISAITNQALDCGESTTRKVNFIDDNTGQAFSLKLILTNEGLIPIAPM